MPSVMRAGGCCATSVLLGCLLHTAVFAAAAPPDTLAAVSGPLTLERALTLTARHEPELRAAAARTSAARARIDDARRQANPTLDAGLENFGGGLGGQQREATLALSQPLDLGGERRARTGAAQADHALAAAQASALERTALAETAERFLTAWELQARHARLRDGERLAEQAIRAATERFQAGAAPRLEILRAQGRASTQAMERRRLETALTIARRELALRWGATEGTFDSLVAPEPSAPSDTTGFAARLARHPDLAVATASEASAVARVRLARTTRVPVVTVSGGVRHLQDAGGTGLIVGIGVPLPLRNRGAVGLAAAERELEAAAIARSSAQTRLHSALATALDELAAAVADHDSLRVRIMPAQEQVVEELLRGYRSGRSAYLDLVAEQDRLRETELDLISARASLVRARLRLEWLTTTGPLTPQEKP